MLNADAFFTIIAIVVPLVELLGIIAAVHAIMNARTSQGAIAWGISLVTFPWLALILYAIFGRNRFKGYVSLRNLRDKSIRQIIDVCQTDGVEKKLICEELTPSEIALTRLANLPMTRFNKTWLLLDGEETFRSIFDGIDSAKKYILVQFYIIKDDELVGELKTRLIQKAREHVKVYFLYDEIGSYKLPGSDLNWDLQKAENRCEKTLIIASGPVDPLDTCSLMFVHAIHMARERLWIASPYFVPDGQVLSALKLAVLRGVEVRILIPVKPDHRTIYLASFSYYENTLPFGIRLYRYTKGFMHQKVFLVDSTCAAVGTANLDNRSFRLNFELTLLNFDSFFIKKVENMLHEDFSCSRTVKLTDYTNRSFFFKLAVRSASLLAPVL